MLTVEMTGGRGLIRIAEALPAACEGAVARGVADAADYVAKDVADHTPVKSGKARESVVTKVTGTQARISYSYKKSAAFYMRFVLLGARPHAITPKLQTARGQRQLARRLEQRYRREGFAKSAAEAKAFAEVSLVRKKALAISWRGPRYLGAVQHPGIPATRILSARLAASRGAIEEAISSAVMTNAIIAVVDAEIQRREEKVTGPR